LPTTLTANSDTCTTLGPSTVQTPFDAPLGWDGGCTTANAIDGGALCNGGSCVVSLTIAAPTVAASDCTAIQPATPAAPPTSSYVVACVGDVGGAGACPTDFHCLPPGTGFHVCVAALGDDDCPGSPYTEKHLSFTGTQDGRSCSQCKCGAPSGGKCTARISIYPDSACASSKGYTLGSDSTMSAWCDDLPAGPLGSKSATVSMDEPGSCQPADGGAPIGSVTQTGTTTFCCIPSSSGPPTP
jgi:hypothetical protein